MPRNPENIRSMLDLSTVHVPGPNPDFGELRVAPHDHGWIIFVPGMLDELKYTRDATSGRMVVVDTNWTRELYDQYDVPKWMQPILKMAWKNDCLLISFDSDAEENSELRSYNW